MLERMIGKLPEGWREIAELIAAPLAWVPRLQLAVVEFFLDSPSPAAAAAKYVLLAFPALLGLVAIWCTQLSLYTLPFRSARSRFLSLLLLAWWDAARMTWMYWLGLVRLAVVATGWVLALAHFAVRLGGGLVRHVGGASVAVAGRLARDAAPGTAWLAVVLLLLWCALEAAVLTHALATPVTTLVAEIAGAEQAPPATRSVLAAMLFLLVLASFACVQGLADAVRSGRTRFLAQMVLVQLLVGFFEVVFLYRELVVRFAPTLTGAPDIPLAPGPTLALAAVGWIGVRALTWMLFGRYGAPPMIALIARSPLTPGPAGALAAPVVAVAWWRPGVDDLRRDLAWLHDRSETLLEYLALPALHVLGAALNFAMILTAARPAFSLPFRGLRDATETRDLDTPAPLTARRPSV